ncbi:MAG: U32 family peptidase [Peptococcaceae bacterium]|nr:U32 family peptidase [Peptococcaceae bacterium]
MKKPELLAPAGDMEKLKVAVAYGADAVYLGGRHFGLRAGAGNFDNEELVSGVLYAHQRKVKVYVTVNIFAHNNDLSQLPNFLDVIGQSGADGVIVSDPGVLTICRKQLPELAIHLSTQANTTNWAAVGFWAEQGVKRIILARELSLTEIIEIHRRNPGVELEIFVHGAMCVSYSGRCLLSNYFTGRDANRGDCAQSCRWKYALMEEKRPGLYLPIREDNRGTYIMSAGDLCLLKYVPELVAAGINSFKIEGRMKSVHYLAGVVKAYREAIDGNHTGGEAASNRQIEPDEISKVSHRAYSTGFLFDRPMDTEQGEDNRIYQREYSFIGLVRDFDPDTGMALVEQRNHFSVGDRVEILTPAGKPYQQTIDRMYDLEGNSLTVAPHPQQLINIPVQQPVCQYALLRKELVR